MFRALTTRAGYFALGLALFALMAPTGGFPSRPRFQAVGVGTSAPATAGTVLISTVPNELGVTSQLGVQAAGSANFGIRDATNDIEVLVRADSVTGGVVGTFTNHPFEVRTNNTARLTVSADGTAVQVNGAAVATTETGSFTASFDDACTTTPTITFDYQRVKNVVTLRQTSQSGFSCTADSTAFATTATPVPTAIRPTSGTFQGPVHMGYLDNGANTWAVVQIGATGNVSFLRCGTFGALCSATGWTNSGSRGINLATPVTYFVGTP
jgi:hypothetical protein